MVGGNFRRKQHSYICSFPIPPTQLPIFFISDLELFNFISPTFLFIVTFVTCLLSSAQSNYWGTRIAAYFTLSNHFFPPPYTSCFIFLPFPGIASLSPHSCSSCSRLHKSFLPSFLRYTFPSPTFAFPYPRYTYYRPTPRY